VPHPPYADTTGEPDVAYRYAVAALADTERAGPLSAVVEAASLAGGDGSTQVTVEAGGPGRRLHRPWQPMIGSEHLSHLLSRDLSAGRPIGAELAEALRIMRAELGVRTVRAHAILCDDLGVYREVDGQPVYDFSRVDEVYDRVLELGLRPVVELSFMPRDLASDPTRTVFAYGAIVSPPKDWRRSLPERCQGL
jgi:xylan 1,4-beta-xylosidase